MLIRAYLPSFLTALTGGLFICLGILTFGKPLYFDRIFLGVLIFTLIICRKDINVVGVALLLLVLHFCNELAWLIQSSEWIWVAKLLFYAIAAFTCYWTWYDKLTKILLLVLFVCLLAEIFWATTSGKTVFIHWFVLMMSFSLIMRDFIFCRVKYTQTLFKRSAKSINLDWKIYNIEGISNILLVAMIGEYLIRNLAGFENALLVYQLYPYGMQILSTVTIWLIFNESTKLLTPYLLRA